MDSNGHADKVNPDLYHSRVQSPFDIRLQSQVLKKNQEWSTSIKDLFKNTLLRGRKGKNKVQHKVGFEPTTFRFRLFYRCATTTTTATDQLRFGRCSVNCAFLI